MAGLTTVYENRRSRDRGCPTRVYAPPLPVLAVFVGVLLLHMTGSGAVRAQEMSPSLGWELTALAEPAQRVFAPAGGTLFANAGQRLLRSDDSGESWQEVNLPSGSTILDVDPTDAAILYAAAGEGVYRSDDSGASWRVVLEYGPTVGYEVSRLAVSPADHRVLYVGIKDSAGVSSAGRLLRSLDAGQTWQPLVTEQASLCGWTALLLQPHPLAAGRVFRATACLAGRTFGAPLEVSNDAGATWLPLFNAEPSARPTMGYPLAVGVARDSTPGRYYLAASRDARLGGSEVFRSDDDGSTWNEVLAFRGGGTPGYQQPGDDPDAPNVRLGGLVVDPGNADRVYVGQLIYREYPPKDPVAGGVLLTLDGGSSWNTLGQDLGGVNDLVLASDSQALYAATDQGVWRFALADAPVDAS
jgi:photosystem II stability/assembly factor-like uncharacterized protein